LKLAGAGAVAAAFATLVPDEALAADPIKVKQAKVARVSVKLYRVTEKTRTVVATIDLEQIATKLQQAGTFDVRVEAIVAPDMNESVTFSERKVVVEKA
jgi:hypothetical protein